LLQPAVVRGWLQDGDSIDTTNRNRQLPALRSSVGQLKAEVVAARLRDINPALRLTVKQVGLRQHTAAAAAAACGVTCFYSAACMRLLSARWRRGWALLSVQHDMQPS
jgi:tRNA A37 threonylcarbamoyladenosine dehydratase